MADFNWDDHPIADKGSQKGGFNWDDHPLVDQEKPEEPLPKRLLRSTIDTAVPVATGLGAALLATPETGGLGTVPAGAFGYAAGKQLARILNNRILGDSDSAKGIVDQTVRSVGDVKDGAMYEMGGQILGAVPGLVKAGGKAANNLIKSQLGKGAEYTPIANKEAVEGAAESLGLKAPKALLTDNKTYQELESGLSQSGSFPAKQTRREYDAFNKGLDEASSKLENLKNTSSDFKIGSDIKSDLAKQVTNGSEPVSQMYKDLHPQLKKIEVNEEVVNKAFGALKRNPLFQTAEGRSMAEEYQSAVKDQPELASLKELRSTLHDSLGRDASPLEQKRVDAIYDAMTSVRDNTVNALKDGRSTNGGKFDQLIDTITSADQAHSAHLDDLNSIKHIVGGKEIGSPSSFLRKLGDMKESDLAQRVANLDVQSLKNLKAKYPTVFERAQAAKMNDMVQSSTNPASGFNVNRFMKQYGDMDQEARELIFPPEIRSHIENLQTVIQAKPEKLGPSGTAHAQMTMDMFNPKRNLLDYGIKKVLDSEVKATGPSVQPFKSGSASFSERTGEVSKPASLLRAQPSPGRPVDIPKAADSNDKNKPSGGPTKWATDGLKKLIDHASSNDKAALQGIDTSALDDQKLKDMLVAASDLPPGSRAMDKVLAQVKARLKN
jgi:hypothetical protein